MLERYDTCVGLCDSCDKVEALSLDWQPPVPHPSSLNFPLTSAHSQLSSAPQRRRIVSKPLLVSGELREKAEAPSLSPPLVPPDPGPIF